MYARMKGRGVYKKRLPVYGFGGAFGECVGIYFIGGLSSGDRRSGFHLFADMGKVDTIAIGLVSIRQLFPLNPFRFSFFSSSFLLHHLILQLAGECSVFFLAWRECLCYCKKCWMVAFLSMKL